MINDLNVLLEKIVTDGAMEEKGGKWKEQVDYWQIKQKWLEPGSQWQNRAKNDVNYMKTGIR